MSPAPRNPGNRDLPRNLYGHPGGFRYKRPDGSYVYLGHEREAAIKAATAANLHFAEKSSLFDKVVRGDSKSVSSAIDEYIEKKLPKYEIREDTRKNREYALKKIRASSLGIRPVDGVTTRELHLYLESLASDWTRMSYRAQLMQLFAWCVRTGLRVDNPATDLERTKAKRERQRMTLDDYRAIHAQAPTWLQNLMDLQLHTLQRPGDVVMMKWDDLTPTGMRVVQSKTGRRLELQIEGPLRELLNRCRDELLCPYIVHRRPEKLRPKEMRAKHRTHHFQVLLEQAEREFAEVRAAALGERDHPPTLHEIRSLGAALYREAGWPEEKVQQLLGHTELKMTRHYLAGHEAPWDQIEAGLNLASIRY